MKNPARRKKLDHEVPRWINVGSEEEVFFMTICTVPRHENQLAVENTWGALLETVLLRESRSQLRCRCLLAMPDHFHALMSFPDGGMKKVIADMKEWLAKTQGIVWQRDFFDHRLRTNESAIEKRRYIEVNPVRAGLVENPEDWPYRYGW